jgi:hypothetical protein
MSINHVMIIFLFPLTSNTLFYAGSEWSNSNLHYSAGLKAWLRNQPLLHRATFFSPERMTSHSVLRFFQSKQARILVLTANPYDAIRVECYNYFLDLPYKLFKGYRITSLAPQETVTRPPGIEM